MGGGPRKDKKFIQKIMKQLQNGARELYIVDDKFGTPTYTYDFATNVELLLKNELWGLYNMVCEGETSRLEVAREIVEILDLTDLISICEVTSDHFAKEYFAPRPNSERLINKKLSLRGLDITRNWKEALRDYLTTAYHGYLSSSIRTT